MNPVVTVGHESLSIARLTMNLKFIMMQLSMLLGQPVYKFPFDLLTKDTFRALMVSQCLTTQPNQPPHPPGHPFVYSEPNFPTSPKPRLECQLNPYETLDDTVAEQSFEVQLKDIAQATVDFLNGDDSDFEKITKDGKRTTSPRSSAEQSAMVLLSDWTESKKVDKRSDLCIKWTKKGKKYLNLSSCYITDVMKER